MDGFALQLNGHDQAYFKDVQTRLPTLKGRDLHILLPHTWRALERPADYSRSAVIPA